MLVIFLWLRLALLLRRALPGSGWDDDAWFGARDANYGMLLKGEGLDKATRGAERYTRYGP